MIINLHGFTGRGRNSKYDWIRANLPKERVEAPDLDYASTPPKLIFERLANLAARELSAGARVRVLGSSLGGFFALALHLARRSRPSGPGLPTVLVNPCLSPDDSLAGRVDDAAYRALSATVAWTSPLKAALGGEAAKAPLHVILGDADEVIDHRRLTVPLLPDGAVVHWIAGGVHRLPLAGEAAGILRMALA